MSKQKVVQKDDLEKFPNARRVLQLCQLENEFEKMEASAVREASTYYDIWKVREIGKAWGIRIAKLQLEEILNRS